MRASPNARHHEDLLSLEELARSLASLDESADAALGEAARSGVLQIQLSRALEEQHGELVQLASVATYAERPPGRFASERLDHLRYQLLAALLRGDGRAASAAAAEAVQASSWDPTALPGAPPEVPSPPADEELHAHTSEGIDVSPFLRSSVGLRRFDPTPKRKHERVSSPTVVQTGRPQKQRPPSMREGGMSGHTDDESLDSLSGVQPPVEHDRGATPVGDDADYDADDETDAFRCVDDGAEGVWPMERERARRARHTAPVAHSADEEIHRELAAFDLGSSSATPSRAWSASFDGMPPLGPHPPPAALSPTAAGGAAMGGFGALEQGYDASPSRMEMDDANSES